MQYITFHSPSEHTFTDDSGEDIRYAMEMQFHHRQDDGQLVIVSVLFKVNAESPELTELLADIPTKCQDKVCSSVLHAHAVEQKLPSEPNLEDIFPFERHFYMYMGGLTSPPCTEPATWYVMRSQGHMSMEQLQKLRCVCLLITMHG